VGQVARGRAATVDKTAAVVNSTGWFRCQEPNNGHAKIGKDAGWSGGDGPGACQGTECPPGGVRRKLLQSFQLERPTTEELGFTDYSKPENAIGTHRLDIDKEGGLRRRNYEPPEPMPPMPYVPNRRRYPLILKRRKMEDKVINYEDKNVCKVYALAPDTMKSVAPCCTHIKTNPDLWITVSKRKGRIQMYAEGVGHEPGAFVDAGVVASAVGARKDTAGHFAIAAALLDSTTKPASTSPTEYADLGEGAEPTTNEGRIAADLLSSMHPPAGTPGDYPEKEQVNYRSATFNQADSIMGCQIASAWGRRKIEVSLPGKITSGKLKGLESILRAKLNFVFMKLSVCKSVVPRTTYDSHCEVRKQILECSVQYKQPSPDGQLQETTPYGGIVDCDEDARKAATAAA
jgi:hypothetical protein